MQKLLMKNQQGEWNDIQVLYLHGISNTECQATINQSANPHLWLWHLLPSTHQHEELLLDWVVTKREIANWKVKWKADTHIIIAYGGPMTADKSAACQMYMSHVPMPLVRSID